jgi:cold shock CspA family protein
MTTYSGAVQRFYLDRRFGFLSYSGGELFFHELDALAIPAKDIQRGLKVMFELGEYKGRQKATNVRLSAPDGVRA